MVKFYPKAYGAHTLGTVMGSVSCSMAPKHMDSRRKGSNCSMGVGGVQSGARSIHLFVYFPWPLHASTVPQCL